MNQRGKSKIHKGKYLKKKNYVVISIGALSCEESEVKGREGNGRGKELIQSR